MHITVTKKELILTDEILGDTFVLAKISTNAPYISLLHKRNDAAYYRLNKFLIDTSKPDVKLIGYFYKGKLAEYAVPYHYEVWDVTGLLERYGLAVSENKISLEDFIKNNTN